MNKQEREELRQTIRQWYEAGFEQDHIANIFDVKPDFVKDACIGLKEKRLNEQHECIKDLALKGIDPKVIAKKCGCCLTSVYNIAKRNNIKIGDRVFKKDLPSEYIERIRAYCEEGHTREETAKHFGLLLYTTKEICKGLEPVSINQRIGADYDRIAQIVSERTAFEYVGNYTVSEGTADVKCKTCGDVRTVAWTSIKHSCLICRKCEERERIRKRQEKQAEKDAKKERMRLQAEMAKEEKLKAIEEIRNVKNRKCTQCGRMYSSNDYKSHKYCSKACSNRAKNKAKEVRRRIKISAQMVDRDISLERLYKRDDGICYLCGRICDWNDKQIDGGTGTIICGSTYPSIDHIIPLAKGGLHSWVNVKLACRGCNSLKSDDLIEMSSVG